MKSKSKLEIALRILQDGGRLKISSGHEIAMSDTDHLCYVFINQETHTEVGLICDIQFNTFNDEVEKMSRDELYIKACECALKEINKC